METTLGKAPAISNLYQPPLELINHIIGEPCRFSQLHQFLSRGGKFSRYDDFELFITTQYYALGLLPISVKSAKLASR